MKKQTILIIFLAFSATISAMKQERYYYYQPTNNSVHAYTVERTHDGSVCSITKSIVTQMIIEGRSVREFAWSGAQYDSSQNYSCTMQPFSGFSPTSCFGNDAKHVFDNLVKEFKELQKGQSLRLLQ